MRRAVNTPEQTRSIGAELARKAPAGTVMSLIGDLGAGKTEFVKGVALGLEVQEPVTSPTFTLIHEYRGGRLPLFHFDFYRLRLEKELDEIGFDEYLTAGGLCAIEWGDKFARRLPPDSMIILFAMDTGGCREIAW